MTAAQQPQSLEACVDAIIDRVGRELVIGTPLGIGKCNALLNALYQRACNDQTLNLKIITALSLAVPPAGSELERRFMTPLAERLWPDYPALDYLRDLVADKLPPNVQVLEFYFPPGRMLGVPAAQRNYINSNYTHVARDMLDHGVNVLMQSIAVQESEAGIRYSLSSNPDVTLDLVPMVRRRVETGGAPAVTVGMVNRRLPFMGQDAIVPADYFDLLVDLPEYDHEPFAMPSSPVSLADHAIGLHASGLLPDGGTMQIGIGSLGDAIVHGCCLRHEHNPDWRAALKALGQGSLAPALGRYGGTRHFEKGLYGASEMFVEGFLTLWDRGVLKRHVYDDHWLEAWQEQRGEGPAVSRELLEWLVEEGAVDTPLNLSDLDWLTHFGIFRPGVSLQDGELVCPDGQRLGANLEVPPTLAAVETACLGDRLHHGRVLQAGFLLGSARYYERLRNLPEVLFSAIDMTAIREVNRLSGDRALEARQRRGARFFNSVMKMTLTGSAVSDGLEDGRVVSGVGGQYDFVSLAHGLPDGRSVLMLRSTRRDSSGALESNIVPAYGHATIPRHLRDIVVTEYGIADLRGQPDGEVIKRLIAVSDARFQDELLSWAQANGKVESGYRIPDAQRANTPEHLSKALAPLRQQGLLPEYPLGTDFTDEEVILARALPRLKSAASSWRGRLQLLGGLIHPGRLPAGGQACLQRMQLDCPHGLREQLMARLVRWALARSG